MRYVAYKVIHQRRLHRLYLVRLVDQQPGAGDADNEGESRRSPPTARSDWTNVGEPVMTTKAPPVTTASMTSTTTQTRVIEVADPDCAQLTIDECLPPGHCPPGFEVKYEGDHPSIDGLSFTADQDYDVVILVGGPPNPGKNKDPEGRNKFFYDVAKGDVISREAHDISHVCGKVITTTSTTAPSTTSTSAPSTTTCRPRPRRRRWTTAMRATSPAASRWRPGSSRAETGLHRHRGR